MKQITSIILLIVIFLNTLRLCAAEDDVITDEYVTSILDGKDKRAGNRQLKSTGLTSTKSPGISLNVSFNDGGIEIDEKSHDVLNALGMCMESSELKECGFLIIGLIDKGGEREEDKVLQRHRTEIIKEFLVSNFSISDERLRVKVKEKSLDFVGSPFLVKRVGVLE